MMNMMMVPSIPLAEGDLLSHVLPHTLFAFHIGSYTFKFTNHMFMTVIVAVLMLILFPVIAVQAKKDPVPTGARNFFEAIMSYLRTEVFRPALGIHADRFTPFLWTLFFFILLNNLLGMIPVSPIVELLTGAKHVGASAMGNLSITAALAGCAFFMIHIGGISQQVRIAMDPTLDPHFGHHGGHDDHGHGEQHDIPHHAAHAIAAPQGLPLATAIPVGIVRYIWNYAPHPQVGNQVLDVALWAFLLILELIGTLVKPFSLCIRLFANLLAGHLLLAALVGMIPFTGILMMSGVGIVVVAGCAALSCLELFVCFLQAYIFTFLTTLFIASAVAPEH